MMEIVHVVKCPKLQRGGTFDLLVTDPECSEAAITAIDMVVGQANFPEGLCVQDPKNPDRILKAQDASIRLLDDVQMPYDYGSSLLCQGHLAIYLVNDELELGFIISLPTGQFRELYKFSEGPMEAEIKIAFMVPNDSLLKLEESKHGKAQGMLNVWPGNKQTKQPRL